MSTVDTARFWDPAIMQQPLSDDERRFRDLFAYEYVKDYEPINAAIRAGMLRTIAQEYAGHLMGDSYVLQRIDAIKRELPEAPSSLLVHDQRKVEQLLWELALDKSEKSSHSARVTAAMGLARIKKLVGAEDEDASISRMEALATMFKEFAKTAPA